VKAGDYWASAIRLLSARIYLSDMTQKEKMNQAWLEWIEGKDFPSRATIGVADLAILSALSK